MSAAEENDVRLDKWLWAARFYKTRALAAEAISGGKVHYNNGRVKPSRKVAIGATIRLTQGQIEREIVVEGLSARRGPASQAQQLYHETEASLQQQEKRKEMRQMILSTPKADKRPNKKDRRQLLRVKHQN